jgi:fructose-1,6-bisphosphatase/inositol monophosphatase family enzyme
MPIFGTLISLLDNDVPQFGIIDIPIMRERWLGIRNQESVYYPDQQGGTPQLCKVSGQKKNRAVNSL